MLREHGREGGRDSESWEAVTISEREGRRKGMGRREAGMDGGREKDDGDEWIDRWMDR